MYSLEMFILQMLLHNMHDGIPRIMLLPRTLFQDVGFENRVGPKASRNSSEPLLLDERPAWRRSTDWD